MKPNHFRQPHQYWSQQDSGKVMHDEKFLSNPEEAKENIFKFGIIEQKGQANSQEGYHNASESQIEKLRYQIDFSSKMKVQEKSELMSSVITPLTH